MEPFHPPPLTHDQSSDYDLDPATIKAETLLRARDAYDQFVDYIEMQMIKPKTGPGQMLAFNRIISEANDKVARLETQLADFKAADIA